MNQLPVPDTTPTPRPSKEPARRDVSIYFPAESDVLHPAHRVQSEPRPSSPPAMKRACKKCTADKRKAKPCFWGVPNPLVWAIRWETAHSHTSMSRMREEGFDLRVRREKKAKRTDVVGPAETAHCHKTKTIELNRGSPSYLCRQGDSNRHPDLTILCAICGLTPEYGRDGTISASDFDMTSCGRRREDYVSLAG